MTPLKKLALALHWALSDDQESRKLRTLCQAKLVAYDAWLEAGGCLECNGTRKIRPSKTPESRDFGHLFSPNSLGSGIQWTSPHLLAGGIQQHAQQQQPQPTADDLPEASLANLPRGEDAGITGAQEVLAALTGPDPHQAMRRFAEQYWNPCLKHHTAAGHNPLLTQREIALAANAPILPKRLRLAAAVDGKAGDKLPVYITVPNGVLLRADGLSASDNFHGEATVITEVSTINNSRSQLIQNANHITAMRFDVRSSAFSSESSALKFTLEDSIKITVHFLRDATWNAVVTGMATVRNDF